MKRKRRSRKRKSYFWRYLFVILLVFIASSTTSYLFFKPRLAFKVPFIENIESQHLGTKSDREEGNSLRLYKPQQEGLSDNDKLRRADLLVTAEDIIRKYMEPFNVRLLDLYMDRDGTIYADFSAELRKDFDGDAFDEYQIIAGLYKTIKRKIYNFNALKILIDGKEVESLGGHIDISKPIGEKIEGDQRRTYRYF